MYTINLTSENFIPKEISQKVQSEYLSMQEEPLDTFGTENNKFTYLQITLQGLQKVMVKDFS